VAEASGFGKFASISQIIMIQLCGAGWQPRLLFEWQPPHADAFTVCGNRRSFRQGRLALNANGSNQVSLAFSIKPLNSQQHDRRATLSGTRKMCVKIVVQCDADPVLVPCFLQNEKILRLFHAGFCDMNRLEAVLTQDPGGPRGKPLGPARGASCNAIEVESLVVDGSRGVPQRLVNVLWLEKRVFGEKCATVGIGRQQFQNTANGNPHSANARFSRTLPRLYSNAIKWACRRHVISV
jgi:hypothetical protein